MLKLRNRHDYDLYGDLAKIKAAFADTAHDARGKAAQLLSQSVENVKERSAALQENVGDYVAKKPLKSLGIAVAAGMLIGYLLHK